MLDIAAYLVYAAILICAAVIDWRTLRIPNKLVIAIMLDWLVWQILRDLLPRFLQPLGQPDLLIVQKAPAASAASGALAAVLMGAGLMLFALAYEALTHRYAMGGGDVKLMAASALFLGISRSLLALMVACVSAAIIALAYAHVGKHDNLPKNDFHKGGLPEDVSQKAPSPGNKESLEAGHQSAAHAAAPCGFPFGPAIALGSLVALFL